MSTHLAEVTKITGRTFSRYFTKEGENPFDTVDWELRSCAITNDRGEILFEQQNVEVPTSWSQMALNVVASRYFCKTPDGSRESGVRQLISRVVDTITNWAEEDGYFAEQNDKEIFKDELVFILLHQYASFNSPVWFNVGVVPKPQCSACFILSVEDTLDSLLELQQTEAMLFKFGSGAGSNLSSIRSSKEKLSGGGVPSGPVSFMRGFDAWAGTVKSGGKTRRAAKMQILNVTHPDIKEFITAKSNEEKKAWALIDAGYDGGFAVPGGAYDSVGFQNANLSVRVSDEFMKAVVKGETFYTINVSDGATCEKHDARSIFRQMAESCYICGDPGLQFDTRINEWHTCPQSGRINASNPCSEYMHLDNSACNLASLNLVKFLKDTGKFDSKTMRHVVDIVLTAQDMLIDRSSYPTKKIENCAHSFRQLGIGFANMGALLMRLGLPYDSDEGRHIVSAITAIMTGQAYLTSSNLSKSNGAFAGFKKNRVSMLKVIKNHCRAAKGILETASSSFVRDLAFEADEVWQKAYNEGSNFGFRNSQTSVLAPTGTISFMMDCDTTGIEPDIGLVKYKKLVGGGILKIVNQSVDPALTSLGYEEEDRAKILEFIMKNDTIEGAPVLKEEHLPVFDCAFKAQSGIRSIGYMGHLRMMAAAQSFISGAISKTVNLPNECTVEEIEAVFLEAWRMGLKSVALYRDGSKRTQPLNLSLNKKGASSQVTPVRRRLPNERQAITHKFQIGGLEGYLTVGLFDDGKPGEIFLVVAKEGSTLSGLMDAFATSVSMALQYGVPLQALVKKFSYCRFEPAGFTSNSSIPMAHSVIDYVFRYLSLKFLTEQEREFIGMNTKSKDIKEEINNAEESSAKSNALFVNSEDAPPCLGCGSNLMVRQAGCYVCLNCGAQGGCG